MSAAVASQASSSQATPSRQPARLTVGQRSTSSHSPLLSHQTSRQNSYSSGQQAAPPIHPGCVLCGLVATAAAMSGASSAPSSPVNTLLPLPSPVRSVTPDVQRAGPSSTPSQPYHRPTSPSPLASPRSPRLQPLQPPPETIIGGRRIIYRDQYFTIYVAEEKEALCRDGRHLVIVLNKHATSVYELGASDVPLLSRMLVTTQRLMLSRVAQSASASEAERGFTVKDIRIGFVNGMPADPKSPYSHLHAQAFLGPFDKGLPGSTLWRRNIVFNSLNWWGLEDLRAEIREETSNNRVKSGYDDRFDSPIDKVPDAGATQGLPNVLDPDSYADTTSEPENPYDANAQRSGLPERKASTQSTATLRAAGDDMRSDRSESSVDTTRYRSSTSTIGSTSSRG